MFASPPIFSLGGGGGCPPPPRIDASEYYRPRLVSLDLLFAFIDFEHCLPFRFISVVFSMPGARESTSVAREPEGGGGGGGGVLSVHLEICRYMLADKHNNNNN